MRRVLAIGALLLAVTGCGTMGNFTRESPLDATPYGGVEIAVDWTKTRPRIPDVLLYSDSLAATNVALSAVGDTLTLPITLPLAAWRVTERLWYLAFFYNDFDERQRSTAAGINDYYFPPNAAPETLPNTAAQPAP
jgi:hypothetical protein